MQKTIHLFRKILKAVAPPPKLTISEWADKHRKLSRETSAEPGQWRTDRAPYQREIMDSISDPRIEKVVVMSSSQVGKSEIINNTIGYYIDVDPCPMLLIQPTIETAEDYSKRRIAPMIRDTEVLAAKVSDSKTRDSNNTILMKSFPGGFLAIGGANSPAGLASRPIRVLLCDEVDRFPDSAGSEGDPIKLAEKRTITFWNRKKVFVSTPTIKGRSRIEQEYEMGTQEKWCVECPGCGAYHAVVFGDIRFDHEIVEDGGGRRTYLVRDVMWRCPSCLQQFDEYTVKRQPAKWIADNPAAIENRVRSFWLNAFVSPWTPWKDIVQEFLESKDDPEKLKVVWNTVFGETWEDRGEQMQEDDLLKRREEYQADLPDGVLLLTAGVDVQDDRLEYEIVGWGHGHESWGIEYGVIVGKPDDPDTWQRLDDTLSRVFYFADGTTGLKVACVCVDSGGHYTTDVYRFTKRNEHRRFFSVKGQGGPGIPLIHKYSRNNKEKALVILAGVDEGKSIIYSSLKMQEPGPKYCHFPSDSGRGYDRFYFQGLLSEKLVPRKKQGKTVWVWEKISDRARNEALDARNYALVAREIVNPNYDRLEERLKGIEPKTTPIEQAAKNTRVPKRSLVKRSNIW